MMPLVRSKRTPVKGKPAVYSYTTRRGTRYIAVAIHDRKQRWLSGFTTARLPGLHFHDLRHVHAGLMGKAKVHPSVMQARLGHADAAMSLEYARAGFLDEQREAAAAVEGLVG